MLPGHAQSAAGQQVGNVGDPARQLGGLRRGLGAKDGVKGQGIGWLWTERETRIHMELCRNEAIGHIPYFTGMEASVERLHRVPTDFPFQLPFCN